MRSPFAENPISEFDKLVAELAGIRRRQKWAGELTARARGDGSRGQFRKALSDLDDVYKALPPKRRTVILKGAPEPTAGAEVIAKAFHTLKHGDLNADQQGRLMLALGDLTDRVAARQATFSKAIPTPRRRADPNVRRRTAAQVAADFEKVEHSLKGAAAHSHMKAATDLIDEAKRMLASDDMALSDHAILSLKLGDLQSKMEEGQVHDKE
jgi:hypothetical protein